MMFFEMRAELFGHYHGFWRSIMRCEESDFYSFDEFNYWLAFMQVRRDYVPWVLYKDYKLVGRSAIYTGI